MKISDNSMRRLDGAFDAIDAPVDQLRANGRAVCDARMVDVEMRFGANEDRTEEVLMVMGITVRLTGPGS